MSNSRNRERGLRLGALLALTLVACLPPSTGARRPGKSMSVISRAEIEAELPRFGTAYDLIRVLRPGMLVTRDAVRQGRSPIRSPSSIPQANQRIRVYLDGLPYGGVETLANIPASTVYTVRWLSALDATTRYGTGNAAGAIMVTTFASRR